ncbi:MAG: hypothetical protein ABI910_21925 [Gemmatimonadota bacterium]
MNKRTWTTISRDKAAARRQAAARPFAEKLVVLDRLRERAHALRTRKPSKEQP